VKTAICAELKDDIAAQLPGGCYSVYLELRRRSSLQDKDNPTPMGGHREVLERSEPLSVSCVSPGGTYTFPGATRLSNLTAIAGRDHVHILGIGERSDRLLRSRTCEGEIVVSTRKARIACAGRSHVVVAPNPRATIRRDAGHSGVFRDQWRRSALR
jgi:hypothetical protein